MGSEPKILYSEKFQQFPELRFGFSTRVSGVSPKPYDLNLSFSVGDDRLNVIKNRDLFFGKLRISWEEVAIPAQCHSANALRVETGGGYERCDALVTNKVGVFLTVSVADCVPLFLYDNKQKAIAAVHVGWRGGSLGIIEKTIELMKVEFETNLKDIVAYIGPAAGVCCYEVGHDVAQLFSPQFLRPKSKHKSYLDLKEFSRRELINADVQKENIEVSELCTICNAELFHSYRREGPKSGRMMGVIGLVR